MVSQGEASKEAGLKASQTQACVRYGKEIVSKLD